MCFPPFRRQRSTSSDVPRRGPPHGSGNQRTTQGAATLNACLRDNKAKLSEPCRKVVEVHGGGAVSAGVRPLFGFPRGRTRKRGPVIIGFGYCARAAQQCL